MSNNDRSLLIAPDHPNAFIHQEKALSQHNALDQEIVKLLVDSDSDIDISIDLHDIEMSRLPSKNKPHSLAEVDDIEHRQYAMGVEDVQGFALIEEPENDCDLSYDGSEELDVEPGFSNKLAVAGTGEGSLSFKFVLPGSQGSSDDASTQILIVEDNTYSAYALMSVL